MKNIAITGYYGFGNFGDDIFVRSLVGLLLENSSESSVYVVSKSIPGVKANFIVPDWFPGSLYRSSGQLGALFRFLFLFKALLRADILINGGGSVFEPSSGLRMAKATRLLKHVLRFKWYAIGVSLSSESESSKDLKKILNSIDYILVRDRKSESLLSAAAFPEYKYAYSGDLAAVDRLPSADTQPSANIYDLSICMSYHVSEAQVIKDCLSIINTKEKLRISIIVLNQQDEEVCKKLLKTFLEKNMNVELIVYDNIFQIYDVLRCSKVVVTARLHGAIASFLLGIPFYLYLHHEKCIDFMETISVTGSINEGMYSDGFVPYRYSVANDSSIYQKKSQDTFKGFMTNFLS